MKFIFTVLLVFNLFVYANELNCMSSKKCTTIENKIPFVGKEKAIMCKYQNGCTSEKIIYRDGSFTKTKTCPAKKH